MVTLILIGACLVAGGLLYLPFFLWFHHRRRGMAPVSDAFRPFLAAWVGRRGRLQVATVRGVPVYVHWSLPLGGLIVAAIGGVGVAGAASCSLAFAALIALHEFGHFAAARALGLKVFAVDIAGFSGACSVQVPRSARHTFLVYSAGLAAQVVVLLLTVAAVALLDPPRSQVGRGIVGTFTFANLYLIAVNLIPFKTRGGMPTDGKVLWGLCLHLFVKGRPHPLAELHAVSPVFARETRLLSIDELVPTGFATGVELLNDDATPMEFVIEMLEKHLKLEREAAIAAMLAVHKTGGMLLPTTDLEQAELAAGAIAQASRERGHPLVCRAVDARGPSVDGLPGILDHVRGRSLSR